MASRAVSLQLVALFVASCSAQWSRWDDTQYCYMKVSKNPSYLCCQGVVYSDPSANLACCDGNICDLKTGKPIDKSSLTVVTSKNGPGPAPPVAIGVILPPSQWVRPLAPGQRPVPPRQQDQSSSSSSSSYFSNQRPASRPVIPLQMQPLQQAGGEQGTPELVQVGGNPGQYDGNMPVVIDTPGGMVPVRNNNYYPQQQQQQQQQQYAQVQPMTQGGTGDDSEPGPVRIGRVGSNAQAVPVPVSNNGQNPQQPAIFLAGPDPLYKHDPYLDYSKQQQPAAVGK